MALAGAAVGRRSGLARAEDTVRGLFPPLIGLLAAAGLTELLLMRAFYRVGVFLPRQGGYRSVHAALTEVGSFAFNLASVLVLAALGLLVVAAVRGSRVAVAAPIGLFVLASLGLVASGSSALRPGVRLLFVISLIALAAPVLGRRGSMGVRVLVGTVVAAVAASSASGFAADAQALAPGGVSSSGTPAQLAGEALVVAAPLVALVVWAAERPRRGWPLAAGSLAALALVIVWGVNESATAILALWTTGLRLFLPLWVYALALGAMVAAAAGWLRTAPWRSAGLVLLLVGGFLLESTYQQAMVLLAVALLTGGAAVAGLPGWRRFSAHASEAARAG